MFLPPLHRRYSDRAAFMPPPKRYRSRAYVVASSITNSSRSGNGLGAVKYTLRMSGYGALWFLSTGVWCVALCRASAAAWTVAGRGGGGAAGRSRYDRESGLDGVGQAELVDVGDVWPEMGKGDSEDLCDERGAPECRE